MKTIAILVGISDYQDAAIETIPGAYEDSKRFASALQSWGLPQEWIFTLDQKKATKAELIKLFYECRAAFDVEAKLIFYFSGHGASFEGDNAHLESSLLLHDTDSKNILQTGLRLVELMQLIRGLKPVQTFLFIDACSLRFATLDNPLNDTSILSTTNSKGLFCMFSSGMKPSYEDVRHKEGYFTSALLKALSEVRLHEQPSCHDLLRKVERTLLAQGLAAPEVYHIGSSQIFPLERSYVKLKQAKASDKAQLIERWDAHAELQDYLLSHPHPIIWMWGEAGLGKTVLAEQLVKKQKEAVYATISSVQDLIEQVRSQKSELFFNRPPDTLLHLALAHIFNHQPHSLIIIDHLDRMSPEALGELLGELEKVRLPLLLISRYPCPKHLFIRRKEDIRDWQSSPFTLLEIEELIKNAGQEAVLSSVLVNATGGNALKMQKMLARLSGHEYPFHGKDAEEFIRCCAAVISTGGFLDAMLFCKTFSIKTTTLATLEKLGLIRYNKDGCFPHDLLEELVEENGWVLNSIEACAYWDEQVIHTPYNRLACRFLVLLASQLDDVRAYKRSLGHCLETLNEREYKSYLLDLITIFKNNGWVDLLLTAADYLIDHEEYQLSGNVLEDLLLSQNSSIRYHAVKNAIRRLVWIGCYNKALELYYTNGKNCRAPDLVVPMRNHVGIAEFFLGNLDTALQFFRKNLRAKKIKDEREIGITKYMLGLILTYRHEELAKAKKLLESSVLIFESTRYYHWLIVGYNGLSDLSYSLEQWSQALIYLKKAFESACALQHKALLLFTLKNIARVQLRLYGANSHEVSATVDAMEEILKDLLGIERNWICLWAENVLATVYAHRREERKLSAKVEAVFPYTEQYNECHIYTLSNLGHRAALLKKYDEAKGYYEQAFQLCDALRNPFVRQEIRQDFLNCGFPEYLQEGICR